MLDLDTGASTFVYSLGTGEISGITTETMRNVCFQPQDLPWLALDPLSGTTPPSGATPITATIDATNANAGDVLAGTVCATSNDPMQHRLGTPITVNVGNPPPAPPTVSKAFNPGSVSVGAPSTLTITLGNTDAAPATLTAPLTDAFPAGLVVATPGNAQTTCVGSVSAVDGGDSVTLDTGSAIPPNATCTVTVDVVANASSGYDNTIAIGDLQTSVGNNAVAASATLTVTPIPPTVTKSFNPATVVVNTPSTLTITLANANAGAANLTAALTDALPGGLVVAATPNESTTCGGALTANAGSGSVTLDGAASIPAAGSCTVVVDVEAAAAGVYDNDIPAAALQTDLGNNTAPADATLTVTP
jgi:hypothetical protein